MSKFAYQVETTDDFIVMIGSTPITPVAVKDYPGIDSNYEIITEEPADGQPDFDDLVYHGSTAPNIVFERANTSQYTLGGNIFNGPRPPHRPF